MKTKIISWLSCMAVLAFLLQSCRHDELTNPENSSQNSSSLAAKYASKSPWKEDEVYIGKVQQVFLKHANLPRVNETYGELHWEYAMSFGQFGERYALVPVVKNNKVTLIMEAVRKESKVYFYEKKDADLLQFFNYLLYSPTSDYTETTNGADTTGKAKYVCTTRTFIVGCGNGPTDCVPIISSQMVCEWKEDLGSGIPPQTFDPCGDPFGGGCGGGGDGGFEYPEPPQNDPCAIASLRNSNAKNILSKAKVDTAKTLLTKTVATDTGEKSFSFGKDNNGDYQTSSIATGTSNSTNIPSPNGSFTMEGAVHTHISGYYNCFSNADIFAFQAGNVTYSSLIYYFAFASDGSAYLFTITDPVKYAAFAALFPQATNIDSQHGFTQGTGLYNSFKSALEQFTSQGFSDDDAFASATAHVLKKYDAGVTLSQQDSSGNFNSIFVEETIIPTASGIALPISIYTKTGNCNL